MSNDQKAGKSRLRVRIFVDYWNFSLSMSAERPNFKADWVRMTRLLAERAAAVVDPDRPHSYEAMHVYASFDPAAPGTPKFRNWLESWLDRQPGVHVSCVPRREKIAAPRCPSCHTVAHSCPSCGSDMRGMEEKGVDTRMVTDMMSLAWSDAYDVALLISADSDFVPLAEEFRKRGIKIIHGQFGSRGAELSRSCWGNLDIGAMMSEFEFSKPS